MAALWTAGILPAFSGTSTKSMRAGRPRSTRTGIDLNAWLPARSRQDRRLRHAIPLTALSTAGILPAFSVVPANSMRAGRPRSLGARSAALWTTVPFRTATRIRSETDSSDGGALDRGHLARILRNLDQEHAGGTPAVHKNGHRPERLAARPITTRPSLRTRDPADRA